MLLEYCVLYCVPELLKLIDVDSWDNMLGCFADNLAPHRFEVQLLDLHAFLQELIVPHLLLSVSQLVLLLEGESDLVIFQTRGSHRLADNIIKLSIVDALQAHLLNGLKAPISRGIAEHLLFVEHVCHHLDL
jgi:hypothetical protein